MVLEAPGTVEGLVGDEAVAGLDHDGVLLAVVLAAGGVGDEG